MVAVAVAVMVLVLVVVLLVLLAGLLVVVVVMQSSWGGAGREHKRKTRPGQLRRLGLCRRGGVQTRLDLGAVDRRLPRANQ